MTQPLRFTGNIRDLDAADWRDLLNRSTSLDAEIRGRVANIIEAVRHRGDAALIDLAKELDKVDALVIEVPMSRCRAALDDTAPALRRAMERAAANIATVARANLPASSECEPEPGVVVRRIPQPLQRVAVYAPGGLAVYPSSVLMGAVPARVAGVAEVILCSPPQRDGLPSPRVLAAAAIADVDRVFALGGAGAIAAVAYGTETVPRVDRIVGPGNAYVVEAKLQVTGAVAIEAPTGPSELLVIADDSCDPTRIALEIVGQAEHDPRACSLAVVVGPDAANALVEAIAIAPSLGDVARESLARGGGVFVADSIDTAIAFANSYAPEHLLVVTRDDDGVVAQIRGAGTVFLGTHSSVAFGDYITGANHVLPTGGLSRSYSGLSVLDFLRWTTVQRLSASAAAAFATDVAVFANAEGLPGHALAAQSAGGLA
jgi:histidinol dehydrogenase